MRTRSRICNRKLGEAAECVCAGKICAESASSFLPLLAGVVPIALVGFLRSSGEKDDGDTDQIRDLWMAGNRCG